MLEGVADESILQNFFTTGTTRRICGSSWSFSQTPPDAEDAHADCDVVFDSDSHSDLEPDGHSDDRCNRNPVASHADTNAY